jgi:hypothetical protein
MKVLAIAIFLLMPSSQAPASEAPAAPMGIGSCWELKPLCMPPQVPVCVCDTMQRCSWGCGIR